MVVVVVHGINIKSEKSKITTNKIKRMSIFVPCNLTNGTKKVLNMYLSLCRKKEKMCYFSLLQRMKQKDKLMVGNLQSTVISLSC